MPENHTFKVASLFAGVGGICYGFHQAGADVVWANEFDPNACRTYRLNHPDTHMEEGDIYKVKDEDFPKVDILTAGFPCQAFSIAGYRKGFEDDRGVLFYEVMRYINATRPRVVFCENVKNLLTHDKGHTYECIKGLLEEAGYMVTEKVMNTMDYGNIPQNRERIYIVAFRKHSDGTCPEFDAFTFPDKIELEKDIHDLIDIHDKKDEKYYYSPDHMYYDRLNEAMDDDSTVYQWRRVYVRKNQSHVCPTLTANMGEGGHNVPIIRDDFGIRKLTPKECFLFQGFPEDFALPDKMANSRYYKQAGNSVSVPVIRRIAENIISALGACTE